MDTGELLRTVAGLRQEADATIDLTKEEEHIIDAAVRQEAGPSGNGTVDVHAPPAVQPTAVSEEEVAAMCWHQCILWPLLCVSAHIAIYHGAQNANILLQEVVAQSKRKRASAVGRLGMQQTGRKRRLKRLRKAKSQNCPRQYQPQRRSAQDFDAPLDMEAEILADIEAQKDQSCSASEQESGDPSFSSLELAMANFLLPTLPAVQG